MQVLVESFQHMSSLGAHNPSFYTVALTSSFNLVCDLSQEQWNPEKENTSKHIFYSYFLSLALRDSFTASSARPLVLWGVERQCEPLVIVLPASRKSTWQRSGLSPAVGLVDVRLWGSVLVSATSLTPAPRSCLCHTSPKAGHSCANLSAARTSGGQSIFRASGRGTSGWSCLYISWQLYFWCRQGCWGDVQEKEVHLAPVHLSRGECARLSVPSLGHQATEFGDRDLECLQDSA